MSTSLTKPVVRRLEREDLIIKITPEGVYTKAPRSRKWYGPVGWGLVHWKAQMVQVNEAIAEKEEKRVLRKVSRGKV
jgi:hypothetical protein